MPLLSPIAFTVIGPLRANTSANSRSMPQPFPAQAVEALPSPVKEIPPPRAVARI